MLHNNNQIIKRASLVLVLIFLLLANRGISQTKYNLQITGGYATTAEDFNLNGTSFDMSINREIWSVISMGIYFDNTNIDNLIVKFNGNGIRQNPNNFFIPPALDEFIKSSDFPGFFSNWSQNVINFTSFGFKTNFDFKMSQKFNAGFYIGIGLTQRKYVRMFLSEAEIDVASGRILNYTPATLFLKATELSNLYGLKVTYLMTPKLNLIFQLGHNASHFKKFNTGDTTFEKINLGFALKL